MIDVAPGTLVVFADIGCPWAHRAVYRLHTTRTRLGLEGEVVFDLRGFPLELINERGTPKHTLDAEIPVAGSLDPEAGWRMWTGHDFDYPSTMLLPMEAVHAAKAQSLASSDRFDRALRLAFFRDGRNVSLHHVIVEVAGTVDGLDADAVEAALQEGRFRKRLFEDLAESRTHSVKGSPHVFLPDGRNFHNPGVEMHWEGKNGGFPVIDRSDNSVFEEILTSAAP